MRLVLVDARGQTIAEGQEHTFSLDGPLASYEHIAEWDVDFPAPGLYFILCYTNDSITRALPLWVR